MVLLNTKSCGRCHNPKVGDKFAKLIITKIYHKPNSKGCTVEAICTCGNEKKWKGNFHQLKSGRKKSCGHCNDPEIGDKFHDFIVIKIFPSKSHGCRIKAQCKCGKFWTGILSHLKSGYVKSCGHCNDPNVGDVFGNLKVVKVAPSPSTGCKVYTDCKCGKTWHGYANSLVAGHTQSCGHCQDPQIGDRFEKLTIIKIFSSSGGGCSVKAQCDCGKYWHGAFNQVKNLHTKSCGNCNVFQAQRNGQTTSLIALKLDQQIQNIGYKTKHNYKIWKNGRSYIMSDIILGRYNIAIEYDEWYWHGHKQRDDELRLRKIQRLGWKTLRIKASRNLPTNNQLEKAIAALINGAKSRTITLIGWGSGNTRFPIKHE